MDAVKKHGTDWVAAAKLVPGQTNTQCRERWLNVVDPSIANRKMGKWTSTEDAKLIDAVKKHGTDWVAVAALVPGRTRVLCRHRWVRRVDPSIDLTTGK
jgi:myb proto-oncogene protein